MDLTSMSRSWGPGVGVGRCLISRTPAAFVGRMAARCWLEVVEDILNGMIACFGWEWKDRFGEWKCWKQD